MKIIDIQEFEVEIIKIENMKLPNISLQTLQKYPHKRDITLTKLELFKDSLFYD